MRRLLITLDDELSPLLAKHKNQNEIVREALRLYIGDITTGRLDQIRATYDVIVKRLDNTDKKLNDMNGKLDYIASKVQ